MSKFKIESDIPIPPMKTLKGYAEAMRSLDIGQSVVLPLSAQGCASNWNHLAPKKFVSRKAEQGGRRVWRIA